LRWLVTSVSSIPLFYGTAIGQAQPAPATTAEHYLRSLGLGASQLRAADSGQVVVKLLKTDDPRDVAVIGMMVVRSSRDAVVARALDLSGFVVVQASRAGLFRSPPTPADVAAIELDRSEYKRLRSCRPGDCAFKLSAPAMQSFATGVDWSAPNAKAQADQRLRGDVLRLVADYERRGNAAMPTYDDGPGVRSADAFAAMLAQTAPMLAAYAPELHRYLTTYPAGRPAGAHDFVYWWEKRVPRMRPTLMVDHVVVYVSPNDATFIVRKQLYANHYTEGGLELLAVLDGDPGASVPVTRLIVVRRFRFDYLPVGLFNVRGRVRNRLVEATRDDLTRERAAIERMRGAAARQDRSRSDPAAINRRTTSANSDAIPTRVTGSSPSDSPAIESDTSTSLTPAPRIRSAAPATSRPWLATTTSPSRAP
jgi:hypothetical protein